MGTKLQYSISPLAITQNNISFPANTLDDWSCFIPYNKNHLKEETERTSDLIKFQEDSMDRRMLQQRNVESIRRTMQMQEDVFKQQVRELHRLYSVQKMLMDEMRNEMKQNNRQWGVPMSTVSDSSYSNFQNRNQPNTGFKIQIQGVTDNPSPSGSCSGGVQARKGLLDLERPAEEDMSTGVSAVEAGPSSSKMVIDDGESTDLELTLSIGGKKKNKSSARGEECSGSNYPTVDDHQRPRWLFQGLNLNGT